MTQPRISPCILRSELGRNTATYLVIVVRIVTAFQSRQCLLRRRAVTLLAAARRHRREDAPLPRRRNTPSGSHVPGVGEGGGVGLQELDEGLLLARHGRHVVQLLPHL